MLADTIVMIIGVFEYIDDVCLTEFYVLPDLWSYEMITDLWEYAFMVTL